MIYLKRMTTIRINPQILEKAKHLGLNVSQACENALRLYITAIENANQKITQNPSALTKREVSEPQGSYREVDRAVCN
jgi:post-segregation antitoxin (ccd killing protein)